MEGKMPSAQTPLARNPSPLRKAREQPFPPKWKCQKGYVQNGILAQYFSVLQHTH